MQARGALNGVARACCVALLRVVLTLEMPVAEFVEIQKLSDEARRARFDLPETCVPDVSAMRPAVANSVRLIVLVDCRPAATSPYEPERTRWDKEGR